MFINSGFLGTICFWVGVYTIVTKVIMPAFIKIAEITNKTKKIVDQITNKNR